MLMNRVTLAGGLLGVLLINLLFLISVEAFAQSRKLYFSDSDTEVLKNAEKEVAPDRFQDTQPEAVSPAPQAAPKKTEVEPRPRRKSDIVVTNRLTLTLKDTVAQTLKNNVSIAVQEYQSQIRQQEIITEESIFDPNISLETKATQERNLQSSAFARPPKSDINTQSIDLGFDQKLSFGTEYEVLFKNQRAETNSQFTGLNPQYTNRFEINLTQPLLRNFGSDINKSNIYIAKNNLQISDFEFSQKVIGVISETENVYWDLVFSREDLKVQLKSVQRARDLERRVKAQVEVGTMAPLEILQAQSEVASREEFVIQARKLILDNQDKLKNILNIPFGSTEGMKEIDPLDEPKFFAETPISLEESIKIALEKRPDYMARQKELDNRNIQVKFNENQLYPSLDLVASFGLNGISGDAQPVGFPTPSTNPFGGNYGRSTDRTFSGDYSAWSGGLVFKYPLGNRAAKSRLTAAKLEVAKLLMDIKDLEKTIVLEVREALREIVTNKKRVQAAQVARKLAEEKLSAEEKKFEVGLSTSFNVLEFQTDLAQEQSKELKAVIDFNKSKIKFRKVLATTLDEYNVKMASEKGS